MSVEFEFIELVTECECPEFNELELEKINFCKYVCLTYHHDKVVGVYLFRTDLDQVTPLWTIFEEV